MKKGSTMTPVTIDKSEALITIPSNLANQLKLKEDQYIASFESKKKGIINSSNLIRYGVLFAVCAVVGPAAYMAIKGIIGLAAFGLLAYIGYNAAPVVALKVTNAKTLALEAERNAFYRALDAERNAHINKVSQAAANDPIATAKSQSLQYKNRAKMAKDAITAYSTELKNFESMTIEFGRKYPDNAHVYKQQLMVMQQALELRKKKYEELMAGIDQMDEKIAFLEANWKMSQALQKANALGGMSSIDPLDQTKADAVIDAVRTSINKALSEMESAAMEASVAKGGTPYDRAALVANASSALAGPDQQNIENVKAN